MESLYIPILDVKVKISIDRYYSYNFAVIFNLISFSDSLKDDTSQGHGQISNVNRSKDVSPQKKNQNKCERKKCEGILLLFHFYD